MVSKFYGLIITQKVVYPHTSYNYRDRFGCIPTYIIQLYRDTFGCIPTYNYRDRFGTAVVPVLDLFHYHIEF